MSPLLWLAVGALGGIGALARFALDGAISARWPGPLPWGTLAVNASGALALGLVVGVGLHGAALELVGTAVLGSYTTFSTWMLESHRLGEDGQRRLLLLNLGVSLVGGLSAAALGRALGASL